MDTTAPPTKQKSDSNIVQLVPKDILEHHIIPPVALDWLCISKEWSEVAFLNLACDKRVHLTKESICQAVRMGHIRIVKLHLQDTNFKAEYVQDALVNACVNDQHEIAALILKDPRIDSMPFCALVHYSNKQNVINVLLEDPRIDPSMMGNKWIKQAVANGWLDTIKLLLADDRVDPTDVNDLGDYYDNSFDLAVETGDCTIIQLLLESPNIDPIFYAGYTLLSAMHERPEQIYITERVDIAAQLITTKVITKIYRKHFKKAKKLSSNNKMTELLNALQIEE